MIKKEYSKSENESLAEMVRTLQNQVQEQNHRLDALEHLLFEAKDVLTVEEAAMFLGLSKSFVYKMTHESSLPFYKPNGKVCYFEKAALLDWMRSTKVASKKEIDNAAKDKIKELASK